jgi:hypothetical protein
MRKGKPLTPTRRRIRWQSCPNDWQAVGKARALFLPQRGTEGAKAESLLAVSNQRVGRFETAMIVWPAP